MSSKMPPKKSGSSDIFYTPPHAVRYITKYIPKSWKIWENAKGTNQIVNVLEEDGYNVIGTDINDGFDFMDTLMPLPEFDCVLTNPPFSIKDKWLERCYSLNKPFALLLPLTALGEQKRVAMFKKNGIQLLMPPERINFGTPSGQGSGAWFYSAWFCHGLDLPSQITFS